MHKPPNKKGRGGNGIVAAFAKWHRRIGIASAVLVVWLACTGIFLGHTDDLGLDDRHVASQWLLDWYGIAKPDVVGYPVGDTWVLQAGERVYVNHRPLRGDFGPLRGAAALGDELVVAAGSQLIVLTREGELVEVLSEAHGVPRGLYEIGLREGRVIVSGQAGHYVAGEGFANWRGTGAGRVVWSRADTVPQTLRDRVANDHRASLLTLERLVLDVHSGRFFGRWGAWIVDLAAFAFLALAGTGFWLWWRR